MSKQEAERLQTKGERRNKGSRDHTVQTVGYFRKHRCFCFSVVRDDYRRHRVLFQVNNLLLETKQQWSFSCAVTQQFSAQQGLKFELSLRLIAECLPFYVAYCLSRDRSASLGIKIETNTGQFLVGPVFVFYCDETARVFCRRKLVVNDLTGSQPCAGNPLTCPALYIVLAFGFFSVCVFFSLLAAVSKNKLQVCALNDYIPVAIKVR